MKYGIGALIKRKDTGTLYEIVSLIHDEENDTWSYGYSYHPSRDGIAYFTKSVEDMENGDYKRVKADE